MVGKCEKSDVWESIVTEDLNTATSSPWIRVQGIILTNGHRKDISDGMWLDDNIINAFQILLSRQHPEIGGLVDTLILSHSKIDVVTGHKILQIHHLGAHWLIRVLWRKSYCL